ncbi:hypothetical protein MNBD_NITROSPINAE01-1832 [hydrothermal vent metagenome]|uniref:Uncharacterized protein n=1 Tax=hydrothermal vent metagenome TaxID=652676 RepID=A0A3B1CAM2_9ZZZZ
MSDLNFGKLDSFFGEGVVLKGTLTFKGALRFDGEFEGTVRSEGVFIVGKSGNVHGDINAGEFYNFGGVVGDVNAKNRASLHPDSSLRGNVKSPLLTVEEGAAIHGSCSMPLDQRPKDIKRAVKPSPSPVITAGAIKDGAVSMKKSSSSSGSFGKIVAALFVIALFIAAGLAFVDKKQLAETMETLTNGSKTPVTTSLEPAVMQSEEPTATEVPTKPAVLEPVADEQVAAVSQNNVQATATEETKVEEPATVQNIAEVIKSGDYKKAIAELENGVARSPDDLDQIILLAETYQRAGLEKKALEQFIIAGSQKPDSSVEMINKGYEQLNAGELDEAKASFNDALKKDENEPRARVGLASIYVKVGANKKAVEQCQKALEITPDYAPALNRLAWVFAKQGVELEKARAMSEKSLSVFDDIPEYIDTLSEVHYSLKEYDTAISLIKKAIALAPDDRYYERQLFKFESAKKRAS